VTRRLATALCAAAAALACPTERTAPRPPPIPDAELPALYAALTDGDTAAEEQAVAKIAAAEDQRFVAVLLELLRAGQMGIGGRAGYNQRLIALERLTGKALGGDWFGWAEWYASTDLAPPPGFASWKGSLWSRIDPRFEALLRDEHPVRIRVEEVDWAGVRFDGVPALDQPAHVAADAADWLAAGEPVVGVAVGGAARAYPLRILDWHELVNDTLGGVPLVVSYCPLSGAAIAYDALSAAGPRSFVSSGLLLRSNKLMLDRGTETLWSQLDGRPVLGPLAADGAALAPLPAVVTSFRAWRKRHPETTVLSLTTGHERPYVPGIPYGAYYQSPQKLSPALERRRELPSKERVFALIEGGVAKAWPLRKLVDLYVANDTLGETGVVLVALEGRLRVEGRSREGGPVTYEAGGAVRAYGRGEREFGLGADDATLRDAGGAVWRIEEEALVGPDGATAPRLPGTLAYWFAWQAFHPDTLVDAPEPERIEVEPLSF
jgi:hypothetical protein